MSSRTLTPSRGASSRSSRPSRTGRVGRVALTAAALSALGALAGCKSTPDNSSAAPTPGPTTMNTPMGNMRSGIPQTMPVEMTPTAGPTTAPHPPTVMGTESREPAVAVPSNKPAAPAVAAPAVRAPTPTHVLTADEPYFNEPPAPGAAPTGTLTAGSKVLVVVPGVPYSQVTTPEGTSVYTVTDGLKPVGEK